MKLSIHAFKISLLLKEYFYFQIIIKLFFIKDLKFQFSLENEWKVKNVYSHSHFSLRC